MKLPTGCSPLDALLRGGVESGNITELYGGGGTGKTNLCLQLTRNAALKGKKVIYLDTEGISTERLKQMSRDKSDKVLQNTLFFRAHSFKEQTKRLEEIERLAFSTNIDIGLIVVDSMTIFYRTMINCDEKINATSMLGRQMVKLLRIARKNDVPIVITTQVYQDQSNGTEQPLGGHMLYHNSKTIIKIQKKGRKHVRQLSIVKHRSLPERESTLCRINDEGLVALD
ncbi:MAG: DNA repair and recombination protein RadB [Thermoplasmata archaeon]